MEIVLKDPEKEKSISKIISSYQQESKTGQWYITNYGLKQIATVLGGEYSSLTNSQKKRFRADMIDWAMGFPKPKTWWYYISIN